MMSDTHPVTRRGFISGTVAALAAAQATSGADSSKVARAEPQSPAPGGASKAMPYGLLGNKKLSRLFLAGTWSPAVCTAAA